MSKAINLVLLFYFNAVQIRIVILIDDSWKGAMLYFCENINCYDNIKAPCYRIYGGLIVDKN